MEHDLGATDGVVHALVAPKLTLDDLHVQPVDVRPQPGREVVEDADVVTTLDERIHEIRADEPGPACHQRVHPRHFPSGGA